ncbi:NUMOD4 domain-containing protein [Staphylococcus saprophyticus]|nr:NUMOD4 domain-containing protein [Staphylococcus saprophyticus]
MSNETWKDIKEYEGLYSISSTGRVKRLARNRIIATGVNKPLKEKEIKTFKGKLGYIHVNLWKNGQMKQHRIHRLIMLTFTNKPQDKNVINHIDGDKTNNTLDNLEWCTARENTIHVYRTGLAKGKKGNENSQGKLTDEEVIAMRKLYATGDYTQKEIGEFFGVSRENARDIVNGKRWAWLKDKELSL